MDRPDPRFCATAHDISQCQFDKWYHLFPGKTFKSRVIPLSKEFIDYLGEDGVILPDSAGRYFAHDALSDDEDTTETETERAICTHNFAHLEQQMRQALAELGEVAVKMNWSAPLDATWMLGGSLKCRSTADIYTLLKSSDRVTFDLERMYDLCEDGAYLQLQQQRIEQHNDSQQRQQQQLSLEEGGEVGEIEKVGEVGGQEGGGGSSGHVIVRGILGPKQPILVLRKWATLNPAMEFRIFLCGGRIAGACQRDCCTYYDFLQDRADDLAGLLQKFVNLEQVKGLGAVGAVGAVGGLGLRSCVLDVFIDRKDHVWLVDVNPFGEPTCSLLFDWTELYELKDEMTGGGGGGDGEGSNSGARSGASVVASAGAPLDFELRIVESDSEKLQSSRGSYRGPVDVHAAADFKDFMGVCKRQQSEQSDDDA
ncbi:D123-domain-containing protein [Ochromonadaceae sp. CCMP2298]|nr:D123-domain-containing protein [Ochromonadaceae sp. CCMP2298]